MLEKEDFWVLAFHSVSGVDCLEPRSGEVLRPVVLLEVVVHGRVLDCYRLHRLEREGNNGRLLRVVSNLTTLI